MNAWCAALLLTSICTAAAAAGEGNAPGDPRRSGFDDMSPALQALQADDTQNPAWLWLKDGQQRFAADCAACHAPAAMRSVATRYPAFDTVLGKPLTLNQRIDQCRQRKRQQPAPPAGGDETTLALGTYLGHLARGLPIAPPADPRLDAARAEGERLWRTRFGQLGFSCSECHDDHAGGRLAGSPIPQAHPTGYPIYRLEWQGMGILERRMAGCMRAVRAQPFKPGSEAWTALELFMKQRAAGMPVETPAVRP